MDIKFIASTIQKNKNQCGITIAFLGGMFCNKTTNLINLAQELSFLNMKVIIFKHNEDNRFTEKNEIISHGCLTLRESKNITIKKYDISTLKNIINNFELIKDYDAIFIEEAHFLNNEINLLYDFSVFLYRNNKSFAFTAIDTWYTGDQVESISNLINKFKPDFLFHQISICSLCNNVAIFSKRMNNSSDKIQIGNSYIPVCRKCFIKE